MSKDTIQMNGKVKEVLPGGTYKVELENKILISATTSGKLRQFHIQIIRGDDVTVELSTYDLTKGRITYRK